MSGQKHTILGTAGHIDHGKTALIKALTQIDTDVLKEEKERGITIELGFAYWQDNVTIIDVPGHERFVKTMVAGVSTIDLFLLVIAADDGVMPQTVEHLDILRFFGVKEGIVALNKIDLVDEEWRELIEQDIRQFLDERGYAHVPILPVSATSGQGVEELRKVLLEKIARVHRPENNRPFRLNVDRSFSIRGAGTVVTGTVLSDSLKLEEALIVLPQKKNVRVRGIQVHQKDVPEAHFGQRAAINLSGIKKDEVERGSTLVRPGTLEPTREFLAVLHTASAVPVKIKKHQEVRVYLGTAEWLGHITWFEDESVLQPKSVYHARIRLKQDGVCAPGDAVLIRTVSPFYTVAGGRVLQTDSPPFGKIKKEWQNYFRIFEEGELKERVLHYLQFAGFSAKTNEELARHFFEKAETTEKILRQLEKEKALQRFDFHGQTYFIPVENLNRAEEALLSALRTHDSPVHREKGFNRTELLNIFKRFHGSEAFLERLLQRMVNRKKLVFTGEAYFLPEHADQSEREQLAQQLAEKILDARFQAPLLNEITAEAEAQAQIVKWVLGDLVKKGTLHSLNGPRYLHRQTMETLLDFLRNHFAQHETIDLAAIKDFTGVTRKYLIPLMEYLDQNQWTIRDGDLRRKGPRL